MTLDEILALPTLNEQVKAFRAASCTDELPVMLADPRYMDWLRANAAEIIARDVDPAGKIAGKPSGWRVFVEFVHAHSGNKYTLPVWIPGAASDRQRAEAEALRMYARHTPSIVAIHFHE